VRPREITTSRVIMITGIGDHHRLEWPITFTGMRNERGTFATSRPAPAGWLSSAPHARPR
jgi:hypothetical protein